MAVTLIASHDQGDHRHTLADGVSRVGADPDCEFRVDHPEAPAVGLLVEVSGASVLVRNRCDYDIYVGADPLAPQQMLAWSPGDELLLSRSIRLRFESGGISGADMDVALEPEESPFSQRRIGMMAVIALCVVIGLQQTLTEKTESKREIRFDFEDLRGAVLQEVAIAERSKKPRKVRDWSDALRLLQEARYIELRLADSRPNLVVEAYQRLLDSPALGDDDQPGEESPVSKLERYATTKKDQYED